MHRRDWTTLCAVLCVMGGCAVDPVADCESQCTIAVSQGCVEMDPLESCDAACVDAIPRYEQSRAYAERYACGSEFDSYYACLGSVRFSADPVYVNFRNPAICVSSDPCGGQAANLTTCVVRSMEREAEAAAYDEEIRSYRNGGSGSGGGTGSGDDVLDTIVGLGILGGFL